MKPNAASFGAIAAADGRFIARVPAVSRTAWARDPGHAPAMVAVALPAAGAVDGVEIRLQPSVTLTGRLLGLEAPDCKLDLYARGVAPFAFQGHADAPGHYGVPGLGPGNWTVVATCGEQSALRLSSLRPGEAAPTLDLDFGPGPLTLSGRVLGEPGARYEVSLDRLFAPAPALGRAEVGSGGRFHFSGLQPGTYLIYVFEPELPADTLLPPFPRPDGEVFGSGDSYESIDQREVELESDREVTLDVRGADGAPPR